MSRRIETLAFEAQRLGLQGRVNVAFGHNCVMDPNPLKVWRKGKLVAQTPEVVARLALPGRSLSTRFMVSA